MLNAAQEASGTPVAEARGLAARSTAPLRSRGVSVGVRRLVLTDFRNYRSARLDLDTGPVVLTGPNGAGKTNLLEAISFLSPGRGLRNARLGEIDRRDDTAGPWAVAATVETRRASLRIGTGRESAEDERRVVRIDGEPVRGQAALAECLGVLWLTPQMDRLFLEGPGGRRRFLDRLVLGLDPAHAGRVARYEQALRERSRLLRPIAQGGPSDPAWLSALEDVMAEQGVAVAAARREAVECLDRACAEAAGPFPRARLTLDGTVEAWLAEMPALAAEEKFKAGLAANRAPDAASGGAGLGPHRSDLGVTHAEKAVPAGQASTGEQKALLISIVLAHAAVQREIRGDPPILLLDEVAAHLDAARRDALFERLAGLETQTWLTGTDAALFAPLRATARFVSVAEGSLSETTVST